MLTPKEARQVLTTTDGATAYRSAKSGRRLIVTLERKKRGGEHVTLAHVLVQGTTHFHGWTIPAERFRRAVEEGKLVRLTAREAIEAHAEEAPGQPVVVYFRKRTNGSLRRMVCLYDAERAARARFRFDPEAKGLLPVFDCEKGAQRFVSLEGVRQVVRPSAGGARRVY